MFTHIVANNKELCTFVEQLHLPLSRPQLRHVVNVADGVLVSEARHKTLAEIQRQFVSCPDPSNIADTFRIAPWQAESIRKAVGALMVRKAIEHLRKKGQPLRLLVGLDDSLLIKDPDTHRLQGVDWYYDHAASHRQRARFQNAMAYLICSIVAGDWSFTFAVRPYLRAETVRCLNRKREPDQRLHFVSKYRLARRILEDLHALLPADVAVYVLFDAWYTSARLLKYLHRQRWHAICRIQPNRCLDGQRIDQRAQAQQHQRYTRVVITVADGTETTYLVRAFQGRLNKVPFTVCGLVSRRHYRDQRPVYFISTDLSLKPEQALQWYAKRWNCEIDHFYLKQRLGLGDFRLWSYEAIDKFCTVVLLAWAYIQWRLANLQGHPAHNPGDVIRLHRDEHAQQWLIAACQEALTSGDLERVRLRFLRLAG